MQFGVIGTGRFGTLWARILATQCEVIIHGRSLESTQRASEEAHCRAGSLEEVAHVDVLFISVPISEFEKVCASVAPFVRADTIIADVCSVKVYPVAVMRRVFPESQPIFATHPLFGPDSVAQLGVEGRKIVVSGVRLPSRQYQELIEMFKTIGLHVIEASPEHHDREMAHSHALIHFVGRGLAGVQMKQQEIATPDHESFLRVQKMVTNDTWRLFLDMQTYNPYARLNRATFLATLLELERKIAEHQEGMTLGDLD
jgi:prephenate dehydrogenase